MFSFFGKLSIGLRLTLGFALLILLITVVGVIELLASEAEQNSLDDVEAAHNTVFLAQDIKENLLEARRQETDFFLNWRTVGFDIAFNNYVLPSRQNLQVVLDTSGELEDSGANVDSALLQQIEDALASYNQIFERIVDNIETRGFEDTGLEGEFRQSAAILEESRLFVGNPELQILLLQMRRYEKDYLLRGEQADAETARDYNAQLRSAILELDISPEVEELQTELVSQTDLYLTNFNSLVELDAEINSDTSAQSTVINSINETPDAIISDAEAAEAQAEDELERIENLSRNITIGSLIAAVLLGVGLSLGLRQSINNSLRKLTRAVVNISQGNYANRVEVTTQDELGVLATSFNRMAEQVEREIDRVEERTRDLETAFTVNTQIANILNVERLLQDVVDLIKERFNLYHAHIFAVDETGEKLVLTSGAGHVGRQMVAEGRIIELSNPRSIVARSGRNREGVIVNDVKSAPDFLPHPLLPNTASELAVPLIARGRLLGVLDLQNSDVGYFTPIVLSLMELVAGQIATALGNATLYEDAQRVSRHERAIGSITQRIQSATSVDEILQFTVRELGKALRVPHTAIELRLTDDESSPNGN